MKLVTCRDFFTCQIKMNCCIEYYGSEPLLRTRTVIHVDCYLYNRTL